MKKEYARTPPMSKSYLMASLGVTAAGYLFNGNNFPGFLLLDWKPVFTRLQVRGGVKLRKGG